MNSDGSERNRRLSRRRLLRWGAATATVAAAGCLGDDGNGDDGNGDGNQTNDDEEENGDNGDNNGENGDNGENGENEGEYVEFDTDIETVVQLRGSVVGTGSIDTEEIHEWAVDEQRPGLPLSESGEVGSHSIYEVATDDSTATLAVDESDLVFSGSRSTAEGVLETMRGERERGHEAYEEYAWLLSAVGDGGFVYGGYIPESERSDDGSDNDSGSDSGSGTDGDDGSDSDGGTNDDDGSQSGDESNGKSEGPRRSATGYAVSMQAENGETRARFAATYSDLTEQLKADIRAEIGQDAESREIAFGDNRAYVQATYSDDLIAAIEGAEGSNSVTIGDGGDPTTSETTVPETDTASLPRVSEYVTVRGGLASGSTIDQRTFRTIEDGSLDALDSSDLLLTEPVRRTVELHNNLGQVLFGNFIYLFRMFFGITEVSN